MRPGTFLRSTARAGFLTAILSSLTLCGCALLAAPDRVAKSVFRLSYATAHAARPSSESACGVLGIESAQAAPGFESSRMLYTREPFRLEAFAYSEWADTLPRMLQPALLAALQDSGIFSSVVGVPAPVSVDYRLASSDWELLQHFAGDTSSVRLSASISLFDSVERELVLQRRIQATRDGGAGAETGVAAANAALGALLEDLDSILRRQFAACTSTGAAR